MELKTEALRSINHLYDFFFNENTLLKETNIELVNDNKLLSNKYKKLDTEFKNFKKVSLVQKLDKELMEKTNEIMFLKKKIENLKKRSEPNYASDEEIELNEITIRGKEYYISNDIHKNIYEKLDNDEAGKILGKYIKNKIIYNN
tara:strand:- start:628 stop:1062 length:435 start_codon:yes stop_codon:yes gene_type:complete